MPLFSPLFLFIIIINWLLGLSGVCRAGPVRAGVIMMIAYDFEGGGVSSLRMCHRRQSPKCWKAQKRRERMSFDWISPLPHSATLPTSPTTWTRWMDGVCMSMIFIRVEQCTRHLILCIISRREMGETLDCKGPSPPLLHRLLFPSLSKWQSVVKQAQRQRQGPGQ